MHLLNFEEFLSEVMGHQRTVDGKTFVYWYRKENEEVIHRIVSVEDLLRGAGYKKLTEENLIDVESLDNPAFKEVIDDLYEEYLGNKKRAD